MLRFRLYCWWRLLTYFSSIFVFTFAMLIHTNVINILSLWICFFCRLSWRLLHKIQTKRLGTVWQSTRGVVRSLSAPIVVRFSGPDSIGTETKYPKILPCGEFDIIGSLFCYLINWISLFSAAESMYTFGRTQCIRAMGPRTLPKWYWTA